MRTKNLNDEAFRYIDEATAYWAGFIMADGCITSDRRYPGSQPMLKINLTVEDLGHLQKLREFLKFDGKISVCAKYCSMAVYSRQIVNDLAGFGIIVRKAKRGAAAKVLQGNRHFWRGVAAYSVEHFYSGCSIALDRKLLLAKYIIDMWRE